MSDQKTYAVNPSTGEVQEFDGAAWKPVDKSRIAKDPKGGVAVFDGAAWKPLGGGQQPRSLGQEVVRQGGLTARYAIEGLSAIPVMVGDAANQAANYGIEGINAAYKTVAPKNSGDLIDYRFKPLSQVQSEALSVLPQPENATERIVGDASRFVAGSAGGAGLAKVGELAGTNALAPMGERLGTQAVAGATGGAAYGTAGEYTDNPLIKLAAGLAGSSAGAGMASAAERFMAPKAVPPTTDQIKTASQASFKVADDISGSETGAILRPDPVQKIAGQWQQYLADKTYKPALQPNIKVLIDELDTASQGNITVKGLDGIRQVALDIINKGDPKEAMLAGNLIGRIDDLMAKISPEDVVQGPAQDVADAIRRGGQLWKVYRKSELIDDALYAADLKNSAANSGGNLHNKIKQAFTSILLDNNKIKYFTAEERAAMEKIVKGSWTQDTLRTIGRLAPSSNSQLGPLLAQLGAAGAGYSAAGIPGAAVGLGVPLVGVGAKSLANRSVMNSADALSTLVRSGAMPAPAPVQAPQIDIPALFAQTLMQGARTQPLNDYAAALLRSGGAAVPASGIPNTGPQNRP